MPEPRRRHSDAGLCWRGHANVTAPKVPSSNSTVEEGSGTTRIAISIPDDVSRTFHGRDVFAKAAAKIGLGQFKNLKQQIKDIEKLEFYRKVREGIVTRIDSFGNVITNLPSLDKDTYTVKISDRTYRMRFYPTYNQAKLSELFLIEGSAGTLEISLKNGNANKQLLLLAGMILKIY